MNASSTSQAPLTDGVPTISCPTGAPVGRGSLNYSELSPADARRLSAAVAKAADVAEGLR